MSTLWHIKNWLRVGKNISWKLNFHTLFGFLYLYWPNNFFYRESLRKHEIVLSYIKKELYYVINEYQKINEIDGSVVSPSRNIWLLWWQGEANMPPLVKACVNSTCKNANGAKVHLVTKDNYSSYIDIPSYIFEKREKGYISFAQLSDIIRYMLLEKYGGLWLDATIYTGYPIPSEYFDYNYFIWHTEQAKTCFVQQDDYHGFIVGSKPHEKLVSFVKEMFLEYWKTHDTLVDYLMVDYLIYIAKQSFPDIRREIDSLPKMSKRIYELKEMLDQPYDKNQFEELIHACIFSKLDWHRKYKETSHGRDTLFSVLIEE